MTGHLHFSQSRIQRQGFLSHGPRLLRGGCPDNGSLHPRRLEGPPWDMLVGSIPSGTSPKRSKCQRGKSLLCIHYISRYGTFILIGFDIEIPMVT